MPRKKHYETLGVEEGAKPEEIKRAYRRKAQKAHPDKGGVQKDFETLNRAYECLIDPVRRLNYDATGQDKTERPIEQEVDSLLLGIFQQLIESPGDDGFIKKARAILLNKKGEGIRHLAKVKQVQAGFVAKRDRVKMKSSSTGSGQARSTPHRQAQDRSGQVDNLFHRLIDAAVQQGDETRAAVEKQLALIDRALLSIDAYEDVPIPIEPGIVMTDHRRWDNSAFARMWSTTTASPLTGDRP